MARYRRRRYYKRKVGRWSANIQEVANSITATGGIFSAAETIMTNPSQSQSLVSQTFTIKNIEISFNLDQEAPPTATVIEGVTVYVMFVPQGMTITADYNIQHPEYIMAYKYLGSPSLEITGGGSAGTVTNGQEYQPIRVRTRLARKLQTGDSVVLFIKGINQSNDTNVLLRLSGLVRWWTKAN